MIKFVSNKKHLSDTVSVATASSKSAALQIYSKLLGYKNRGVEYISENVLYDEESEYFSAQNVNIFSIILMLGFCFYIEIGHT